MYMAMTMMIYAGNSMNTGMHKNLNKLLTLLSEIV